MNTRGLLLLATPKTVDETVASIRRILEEKQVKLFALIDHSGEARSAGLEMPNTKLLIFGNPKAGTPLMLASPSIAIDLPLKILVAEGPDGQTRISLNDPEFLRERHGLPEEFLKVLQAAEAIAQLAMA